MRKLIGLGSVAAVALAAGLGLAPAAQAENPEVVVVVKLVGIGWFNAMEQGILKAGEDLGVDASMTGGTTADPAQQVRIVEDLVARGVDAISVVPNDATVLEPVFARAQEAGIPIITHESPDQKNNTWNIELIDNQQFGELFMQRLAQEMGEQGEYIVYVGSLTVPLHNLWADYAIAYQEATYPNMKLVEDRFGVAESADDSFRTALEMMTKYPELAGILTFGSQGPLGAGRALVERNMAGTIALIGGFAPSEGADLIREGVIQEGYIWNPVDAGYAQIVVARMVLDGTPITDGMDLAPLGTVAVDPETRNIKVNKVQPINKETIDMLIELGL